MHRLGFTGHAEAIGHVASEVLIYQVEMAQHALPDDYRLHFAELKNERANDVLLLLRRDGTEE